MAYSLSLSNAWPPFAAEVYEDGPNRYIMAAQDLAHGLACELTLEVQENQPGGKRARRGTVKPRKVVCRFPRIDDGQFKRLALQDVTLCSAIMVIFQMKIMEQLLIFCAQRQAETLNILADSAQAKELGIYQDFLAYHGYAIGPKRGKTGIIMPADQEAFRRWMNFMEAVIFRLQAIL